MAAKPATIGLVALLVLAGCGGVGLHRPPSVTPVPVPTDSPAGNLSTSTSTPTIAPGISREGVTDPLALAEAHAAVLESTSFRVRFEQSIRARNGTIRDRQLLAGAFVNHSVYRMYVRRVADGEVVAQWSVYADGQRLYQRLVLDGQDVHYYIARSSVGSGTGYPTGLLGGPVQRPQLFSLFAGTEPAYAGSVQGPSNSRHRLRSTDRINPVFLATRGVVDVVTVVEFVAFIRDDGQVTSYHLNGSGQIDEGAWRITRRAQWYAVGNTTVDPPWWYPLARTRTDT